MQADAATAARRPALAGPRLRLRWALPAGFAGGLALAAAFPPAGIWPLAVAGPALLTVALSGRSLRAAFCTGLVFGLAFFFPLVYWVINLAWYAWVALAAASALIFAVLAVVQRLLLRLPAWPLAVAGWWVAAEALRDRWPFGGFPWGRLAMSQAASPARAWAAIGGAPVLSFVVALAGATLAWLLLTLLPPAAPRAERADSALAAPPEEAAEPADPADPAGASLAAEPGTGPDLRRPRPGRAAGRRQTVLAALALAGAVGIAVLPAALPLDPVPHGSPTAEVAAIQGDVPRARSLISQLANDYIVTQNHVTATDKLAAKVRNHQEPAPDIVIWPENSTDIDPRYGATYQQIAGAAAAIGRPILVGAVLQNPQRNAGLLWLPGKGPVAMYVKRQLVPFGETLPLRGLISKITSLTQLLPVNFTPGHSVNVFRVGQIRLGDVICYEIGFDALVRSDVAAGANLLTMQTNDATFEREGWITAETGQQLEMARIRAVEHDRAVVVASTTGYSAIIAPDGNLIVSSGTWQQAELEARVPLISYTTLADRTGPWPEYVIVALTVLAAAFAAVSAVRARSANKPAGTPQGR